MRSQISFTCSFYPLKSQSLRYYKVLHVLECSVGGGHARGGQDRNGEVFMLTTQYRQKTSPITNEYGQIQNKRSNWYASHNWTFSFGGGTTWICSCHITCSGEDIIPNTWFFYNQISATPFSPRKNNAAIISFNRSSCSHGALLNLIHNSTCTRYWAFWLMMMIYIMLKWWWWWLLFFQFLHY